MSTATSASQQSIVEPLADRPMHHAREARPHEDPHAHSSPTPVGFWIYLMSDCVIFGALFATYAVLGGNYAGGPAPKDLFEPGFIAVETALLLFSSVTFGLAMLRAGKADTNGTLMWLAVTALFGAGFIGMEIYEFNHLIHLGAGPDRSIQPGLRAGLCSADDAQRLKPRHADIEIGRGEHAHGREGAIDL